MATPSKHALHVAASGRDAELAGDEDVATCTPDRHMNNTQRHWRAEIKRAAGEVASDIGQRAIGLALGKSASMGRRLCEANTDVHLAVGDVVAAGKGLPLEERDPTKPGHGEPQTEWARSLLGRALAMLDDSPAPPPGRELSMDKLALFLGTNVGDTVIAKEETPPDSLEEGGEKKSSRRRRSDPDGDEQRPEI